MRDIGGSSYAFCQHTSRSFDLIFVGARIDLVSTTEFVRSLRTVSRETAIVLIVDESKCDEERVRAYGEQAGFDSIILHNKSGIVMKPALERLLSAVEARYNMRELALHKAVFEEATVPAASLDAKFRIVFANRMAQQLFNEGDPFSMSVDMRLWCANDVATKDFYAALENTTSLSYPDFQNPFITVDRAAGRSPYVVLSVPEEVEDSGEYHYHLLFADMERFINLPIKSAYMRLA